MIITSGGAGVGARPRPLPVKVARRVARSVRHPCGVPIQEYGRNRPASTLTWLRINRHHLTYSTPAQLAEILHVVRTIEHRRLDGEFIEAGCALGGTSILTCSAKSVSRPMRVFDVFGMIPPPSDHDGPDMQARYAEISAGNSSGLAGGTYYAYEADLQGVVRENFRQCGFPIEDNHVSLIAGKVEDTLTVTGPVAFANIDVDWFEPVTACLERIGPHLVVGGTITVRAYSDWSGSHSATDAYFESLPSGTFERRIVDGQLFATRVR